MAIDNENREFAKKVSRVLLGLLGLNLLVMTVKIILGHTMGSQSVEADGWHSFADSTNNIVGIVGIWLAASPADHDHPYGHRKFETFTGLVIGAALALVGIRVISESVNLFLHPTNKTVDVSWLSLAVMFGTLCINLWVSWYEAKKGMELKSEILISDAAHTRSDIFVTLSVIATLIGLKLKLPPVTDLVVSIGVGLIIMYAAWDIIKRTSAVLLDASVLDSGKICEVVRSFPEVLDCHSIRSRGRADSIFIDLHAEVDPEMTVQAAHDLSHRIAGRINESLGISAQTIIHVEPKGAEAD